MILFPLMQLFLNEAFMVVHMLSASPAESLHRATKLTEISLSSCGIDGEGMSHLAGAIMHCSDLSNLELNGNPLGSIGMQELAKVVEQSTCVECISVLGCTVISSEGTTKLLQALSRNQSVQTIFLPEELCTTAPSHLANRALWLPNIAAEKVVDLSNSFIPMKLGKFLQLKNPCKQECRLT